MKDSYIPVLNLLRAIACLGVCCVHNYYGSGIYSNEPGIKGFIRKCIESGQQGVPIFFVISGFVIPWSLWISGYDPSKFFKFMFKRIVRIDPPYIIAFLLVLLIAIIQNEHYNFQLPQFLLHLFYLIPFSSYPWYDGVYWTLCIEFQFYIIIGLVFPLLIKKDNNYILLIGMTLLAFAGYFIDFDNSGAFILKHIHYFVMGILVFLLLSGKLSKVHFYIFIGMIALFFCVNVSITTGCVGALAAFTIVNFQSFEMVITNFLGKISYSLYLVHSLTSGIVKAICDMIGIQGVPVFILMVSGAILFAFLFHLLVERPAIGLSKKIILN